MFVLLATPLFSFVRLASDLLLWEPMAPSLTDRADPCGFSIGTGLDLASQMLHAQGPDRFVMCRSGLRNYDDGNCFKYCCYGAEDNVHRLRTKIKAFETVGSHKDFCILEGKTFLGIRYLNFSLFFMF